MNFHLPSLRSLKTRVTLITLLFLLAGIWSIAFYASRVLREEMQLVMGAQQFSAVTGMAREINDRLNDRRQALEIIAKEITPAIFWNQPALQALLDQRPLLQLLFNGGVFITGTDGTAIADVPHSAGRIGTNYLDRESVSIPLRDGKTMIGRPAMGKKLGAPIFSITAPVFDGAGKVIGAMVATINLGKPNFLDRISESHYGRSGGYLLIAPQHKMIVTATDKSRVMQPVPPPGINAMHDLYMQGYEGFGTAVSSRGVLELSAAKSIPATGWFIAAILPAEEAFAPVDSMLRRLFAGAMALTVLAGVLTWLLTRRMLRQQFAPMLVASRAIADRLSDDQPVQALPVSRNDEVGELIRSFNSLLESYARREELLKASEAFKEVVLNSLDSEIAVVDRNGVIQAVNTRWHQYSLENSLEPGRPAAHTGIGSNYLAACDAGSKAGVEGIESVRLGIESVLAGHTPEFGFEYPCDSPDRRRWFSMKVLPLGPGAQAGAVITHTAITERKLAERALQRIQLMMERTEGMARLASFEWEVDANVVTWSPEMYRIFGRNPDLGVPNLQGLTELYTPESAQQLLHAIDKAVSDGTPYELELMTVQPDGNQRPCLTKGFPERDALGTVVRVSGLVQDITERRKEEEDLRLAASVFRHAREGIAITDAGGIIIDVNEAFSRITGYSREEVIGRNPRLLQSGLHDQAFYAAIWNDLLSLGHWDGEIWNRRKNGELFAELIAISAVRDASGRALRYVALFTDITAIKRHQSDLEHIAHFDALTNLPNRAVLADRLQQAMLQAQRRGQRLAVAYLDLDGFKAVNDQYGHEAGDQVLVTLATRMRQTLRESDTLSRMGGDEFVAVLSDLDDMATSQAMLTRLLVAAAQPVKLGQLTLQLSASLGVTFYPQASEINADQLLRQADQAMYQAKQAGKNRYQIFDAALDRDVRGRHESLDRIRQAVANKEFVLHYQPKVNMRTGQIIGAEALIRWQHPEEGLLAPGKFLPVIETHPLTVELGEWVIDEALTQVELWRAKGLDLQVSVNVNARHLQQVDFVQRLQSILAAHPSVEPRSLGLEVLETSALEDIAQVSRVIEACSRLGVEFALDDFGTGYSSLSYLKRLGVAQIKIDQSFVRDMLDDRSDSAILLAVMGLAAAFKREVIAEGVETVAHGTALLQLGCELAQGYGIARPMPAEEMPTWAATWRPEAAWEELARRDETVVSKAAVAGR
ncbi:putative Diguanylate cyclase [Rubrivivax sp. A210]|uniref:EAL domain-containing protein n=1 Tax=Rubrivivax sp. A210 TaxID=2772301 RepID=UPI0019195B08|nr:EAL domain-containing protein [Rubrivivax sp. A210]CAD5371784.1 putative Diguanylate cyclase [Rubrivivax sp. A210]